MGYERRSRSPEITKRRKSSAPRALTELDIWRIWYKQPVKSKLNSATLFICLTEYGLTFEGKRSSQCVIEVFTVDFFPFSLHQLI